MDVVVLGATGNVGTALVEGRTPAQRCRSPVVGVARRSRPSGRSRLDGTPSDISTDPLAFVSGADAVVDLAWQIQPSRDRARDEGDERARHAPRRRCTSAPLCSLVYVSSVGTLPPPEAAPSTRRGPQQESNQHVLPAQGEVEAMLDQFERRATTNVSGGANANKPGVPEGGRLRDPPPVPRALRAMAPPTTAANSSPGPPASRLPGRSRSMTSPTPMSKQSPVTSLGPFTSPPSRCSPRTIAGGPFGGRVIPMPNVAYCAKPQSSASSYTARLQPAEPGWLDMATQTPYHGHRPGSGRCDGLGAIDVGRGCAHRTARRNRRTAPVLIPHLSTRRSNR